MLRPGRPGYAEARAIHNAITIDASPAAIAQARDEEDVVTAVRYAADAGVPLAVRSGGHGVDGSVMPDAGVMGGAISEHSDEDAMAFSREGAQWFWEVAVQ